AAWRLAVQRLQYASRLGRSIGLYEPFGNQPQRLWIYSVLDFEHPCSKGFWSVACENRHFSLNDDGAGIHLGRNKMDGSTMGLGAGGECALVGAKALESRQQGRVDIDHTSRPQ